MLKTEAKETSTHYQKFSSNFWISTQKCLELTKGYLLIQGPQEVHGLLRTISWYAEGEHIQDHI